jgi:hypothetical protein
MTPEQKQAIQEYVQAIAKILYEGTSPERPGGTHLNYMGAALLGRRKTTFVLYVYNLLYV